MNKFKPLKLFLRIFCKVFLKFSKTQKYLLGKKSDKTSQKEKWQLCGKKSPFSIPTSYYELEIEMVVSSFTKSYTSRGFVVGFVAYDDGKLL